MMLSGPSGMHFALGHTFSKHLKEREQYFDSFQRVRGEFGACDMA